MAKRGRKLSKGAKKSGLSLAKRSNILKYKQAKRGILTEAQKKKKKQDKKQKKEAQYAEARYLELQKKRKKERREKRYGKEEKCEITDELHPLSEEVTGEEMLEMMDPEDLSILLEMEAKKNKRRKKNAEEEEGDGIEAYENEERSFDKNPVASNMRGLLPIKTDQGIIPRYMEIKETNDEQKEENTDENEEENLAGEMEKENSEEEPQVKSTVEFMMERQRKLEEKKIKIGCLAANFIEEPEERLSGLSSLVHFMDERDPDIAITVKKYAALSLLEVFHNIIPSYHIHHESERKLKKETRKLYFYEKHMLLAYQIYLRSLENMLNEEKKKKRNNLTIKQMALVALKCMGELMTQHSHFNYTSNLIQALVPYLNHVDDEICSLVSSNFTKLFKADKNGHISLEVVQRIDQLVRRKQFRVRPEVLKVLLGLKIKNVQSSDAELEAKYAAKRKLTHNEKLIRKIMEKNRPKKSNKDAKLFRKKRKLEEQMKSINEEKVTKVRTTHHTNIIQLVFGLFIHVLKRRPNDKLMGIVLEGLAKFAHLINIEFFADLLNVLGGLMAEGSLKFRESLHCIQVVFTILSGQGEVLTLDPHRFYKYLYANMFNLSLGTNHDDVLSALESLNQMLVERRKRVSGVRVQAFSKRLASLSLTLLQNGTVASLATLRSIILHHPNTEALLETDTEGTSGIFSAEIEEPEHCNAAASSFWELHFLTRHYHSIVQQMSYHILQGAPLQGDKTLPYTLTKRSAEELFEMYDSSEMSFCPAIPAPNQHLSNKLNIKTKKLAKKQKKEEFTSHYMTQENQDLLTAGLLSHPVVVNESPCDSTSETFKGNGRPSTVKSCALTDFENANFYSGMLSNMNLDQIPQRKTAESTYSEDYTLNFLKVTSKT